MSDNDLDLNVKKLKAKRKKVVEQVIALLISIDTGNADVKDAIEVRSGNVEWDKAKLKKMVMLYHKQNYASFKADVDFVTKSYESLYDDADDTDYYDDSESVSSQLQEERKQAIEYISELVEDVEQKKERLKEFIDQNASGVDWEAKVLRKIAIMRHKGSFSEYRATNEGITDDYECIFGDPEYE